MKLKTCEMENGLDMCEKDDALEFAKEFASAFESSKYCDMNVDEALIYFMEEEE